MASRPFPAASPALLSNVRPFTRSGIPAKIFLLKHDC